MKKLIPIFCLLFISCDLLTNNEYNQKNNEKQTESLNYIDCPKDIALRAFEFAKIYEQSDTEYDYGGQDPCRTIKIDCSGLVIMAYKYALVDTKYSLIQNDMTAAFMDLHASSKITIDKLEKGNLIFMGEPGKNVVSHIAIYSHTENGNIYFIDSTQKDTNGDGIDDINGVTLRCYPAEDKRFKSFGVMRLVY